MTAAQLLQHLERMASAGLPIISKSMDEHFATIVEIMDIVGARRLGSPRVREADGRCYILDNYVLPSGTGVRAVIRLKGPAGVPDKQRTAVRQASVRSKLVRFRPVHRCNSL